MSAAPLAAVHDQHEAAALSQAERFARLFVADPKQWLAVASRDELRAFASDIAHRLSDRTTAPVETLRARLLAAYMTTANRIAEER